MRCFAKLHFWVFYILHTWKQRNKRGKSIGVPIRTCRAGNTIQNRNNIYWTRKGFTIKVLHFKDWKTNKANPYPSLPCKVKKSIQNGLNVIHFKLKTASFTQPEPEYLWGEDYFPPAAKVNLICTFSFGQCQHGPLNMNSGIADLIIFLLLLNHCILRLYFPASIQNWCFPTQAILDLIPDWLWCLTHQLQQLVIVLGIHIVQGSQFLCCSTIIPFLFNTVLELIQWCFKGAFSKDSLDRHSSLEMKLLRRLRVQS